LGRFAGDDRDAEFAAAIRASGKVLLPITFMFDGDAKPAPPLLAENDYLQLGQSPVEPSFPLQPLSAVMPLPVLVEACAGLGHVAFAYDNDNAPRFDHLALPYDADFVPSMPVRAAAAYRGVPWDKVALSLGGGVGIGDLWIPTDPAMRLVVNYRGPRGTIPTYSFVDVVEGRLPETAFRGRVVVIGASAVGIPDTYPAPFGNTPMPGSERMANTIDTILHRDFIRQHPPPWPSIVTGLVILLGLVTGIGTALLPTRVAALAGLVPILGWCIGAQAAFVHGLWLPVVNPVVALTATMLSALLFRYGFTDYQRRRIQIAFRHYLAPELVDELADHPERLQLGGENPHLDRDVQRHPRLHHDFRRVQVQSARSVAADQSRFSDPDDQTDHGAPRHDRQYMGDCIMAFWNAPLDDASHADRACETALAMVRELDQINRTLQEEATRDGRTLPPIHIGVGLNSGECVVGNMGSDDRFAYTAMGDAVNLASRLEGQSKTYHVIIVIGEETRKAAPSWAALELDLIAVKGKAEAVRIYTLLGDAMAAQTAEFQALVKDHAAMLAYYRAQDWDGAQAALERCRPVDSFLTDFYGLYEERIAHYPRQPAGPEWEGVFIAETK